MTVVTFDTVPRRKRRLGRLQAFFATISRALDAYAAHRMRQAVPESEQRRIERSIKQYSRVVEKDAGRAQNARRR